MNEKSIYSMTETYLTDNKDAFDNFINNSDILVSNPENIIGSPKSPRNFSSQEIDYIGGGLPDEELNESSELIFTTHDSINNNGDVIRTLDGFTICNRSINDNLKDLNSMFWNIDDTDNKHIRNTKNDNIKDIENDINSQGSQDDRNSIKSVPLLIILILTALIVSVMAAFPYLTYSGDMPDDIKDLICISRYIVYFIIFSGYWLYFIVDILSASKLQLIRSMNISYLYIGRQVLDCSFSIIYATLYAAKWMSLTDIIIPTISIPSFFISWILVFYSIIDKHISSSVSISGSSSSNSTSRKRRVLLRSIKKTEKLLDKYKYRKKFIKQLTKENSSNDRANISILFAYHSNKSLNLQSEERLNLYEEDCYDSWSFVRSDIVNGLLGMSLIPLSLSLLADYGYSISLIIKSEEALLWTATLSTFILGIMYLLATRPIHHKSFRIICSKTTYGFGLNCKENIWLFIVNILLNLPIIFCAIIIASLRINASYSIFGRIAARFLLPYSLTFALRWIGTMFTFLIDYGAATKIISCAIKMYFTLIASLSYKLLWKCNICDSIKSLIAKYHIRWYTKYAKWLVRNCDEETIDMLFDELL